LTEEINDFFKGLSKTNSRLLLSDYDGTLAPFRRQRDKAVPYKGIEKRLDKIISSGKTDVIIISGRAIEDLKPLLKLRTLPEIWGSHGWERLSADGKYSLHKRNKRSVMGIGEALKFIYNNHLEGFLEKKPASIAIHYRGVGQKKVLGLRQKIIHNWKKVGAEFRLEYSEFDGGVELKIPGVNKGKAVKDILAAYPYQTFGAYLGDDLTDEDAFKMLPDSILGILVKDKPRKTAATSRIKPPEELLDFLDRWISIGQ